MEKKDVIKEVKRLVLEEGAWPDDLKVDGVSFDTEEDVGGEGQGEDMYNVLKVVLDNNPSDVFFIKLDGYYSSWDCSEWRDVYEVVPYEKTVRDWKKA